MNFDTLSGVYQNSKKILRLLGSANSPHLVQQLHVIAADPKKLAELSLALDNLDSHIRAMCFEELVSISVTDRP